MFPNPSTVPCSSADVLAKAQMPGMPRSQKNDTAAKANVAVHGSLVSKANQYNAVLRNRVTIVGRILPHAAERRSDPCSDCRLRSLTRSNQHQLVI